MNLPCVCISLLFPDVALQRLVSLRIGSAFRLSKFPPCPLEMIAVLVITPVVCVPTLYSGPASGGMCDATSLPPSRPAPTSPFLFRRQLERFVVLVPAANAKIQMESPELSAESSEKEGKLVVL